MSSSDKSVIVSGLRKSFGEVKALRGVSFEVDRGEVVALLGPNGAGKTTTVDILSTLTRPDEGHASIAGYDVVSQAAAVRRSIMLTGQQVALDDMLTGRENLVLFGRLQGLQKSTARSRADDLLHEFDLVHAAERRVGTYSGGMRRRIDVACGLVIRPEVVFLDEPTTGLDPRSRQTIWDLVAGFKDVGIATLLTTQYLEEADALSDRIVVIDGGVVVAEGTADQLKERTGGSYCEIVPRDLHDLPAIAEALGSLLPDQNRAALTTASDRIAMPAPDGPNTLVEALSRLNAANIELADIALRRPSLDDVFLALTKDSAGASAGSPVPDESPTVSHAVNRGRSHLVSAKPKVAPSIQAALGLSITSTRVGWVLVDRREADGAILDHDTVEIDIDANSTASGFSQHAAALRGAQAIATLRGYQLESIGVTWSDGVHTEAKLVLESLAGARFGRVIEVRLPQATQAWAQTIQRGVGFEKAAFCIIEPQSVTLVIVDSGAGEARTAVTHASHSAASLILWLKEEFDREDGQPESLFLIGSRSVLDAITGPLNDALPMQVFDSTEAQLALARGAALAAQTTNVTGAHARQTSSNDTPGDHKPAHDRSRLRSLTRVVAGALAVVVAVIAASRLAQEEDSRSAGDPPAPTVSMVPASAQSVPPPAVAPPAPPPTPAATPPSVQEPQTLDAQPSQAPVPTAVPMETPSPQPVAVLPSQTRAVAPEQRNVTDVQPASLTATAPAAAPEQPIAVPAAAPEQPIAVPPAAPEQPIVVPPAAPAPPPQQPIAAPPPPDPIAVVLSPLLGALP